MRQIISALSVGLLALAASSSPALAGHHSSSGHGTTVNSSKTITTKHDRLIRIERGRERFSVRYWNDGYDCYVYWCQDEDCYFYWCEPDACYYPVSYCPYGHYRFVASARR